MTTTTIKFCPIKKDEHCSEEHCAWWNNEFKECCVCNISRQIRCIAYSIEIK